MLVKEKKSILITSCKEIEFYAISEGMTVDMKVHEDIRFRIKKRLKQ